MEKFHQNCKHLGFIKIIMKINKLSLLFQIINIYIMDDNKQQLNQPKQYANQEFIAQITQSQQQYNNHLISLNHDIQTVQNSLKVKRQQIKNLANSIQIEVEKLITKKQKSNSVSSFPKIKPENEKFKKKNEQITKVYQSISKLKSQLTHMRQSQQSSMSNEYNKKKSVLNSRNQQLEILKKQKQLLLKQTEDKQSIIKSIQSNAKNLQIKVLKDSTEQLKKQIKKIEKEIRILEPQQIYYNQYLYQLKQLITPVTTHQRKKSEISKTQFLDTVEQLQKVNKEKSNEEIKYNGIKNAISEKITKEEIKNKVLTTQLRELNAAILKIQMNSKKFLKEINDKLQEQETLFKKQQLKFKKKKPIYTQIQKQQPKYVPSTIELGNFQYTSTGVFLSDVDLFDSLGSIQLIQISFFQEIGTFKLLGLQMKYLNQNQLISGKRMISHVSNRYTVITFDIEMISSMIVQYDKHNIYAIKINTVGDENIMIGTEGDGINRIISFVEYKIAQIEVKLDLQIEDLSRMVLKGMKIRLQTKKLEIKNASTGYLIDEDFRTNDQYQKRTERSGHNRSQRGIIHKTSLPKLNHKQIIDHRLMLGMGKK